MGDLISRKALLEVFRWCARDAETARDFRAADAWRGAEDDVKAAPAVDAVEVVRCKDCFANGCCSVQIDLDMGDEGYCPKGRKEG